MRVLIIEDDPMLLQLLSRVIEEEGGTVETALEGEQGQTRALQSDNFDVIILDWMLPDKDGLSVCQDLRAAGVTTPILMLTARGEVQDRVRGLTSGADDYVCKPFEVEELLARVEALSRRSRASHLITVGEITVDRMARKAFASGRLIELTGREFELFEQLAIRANHVVSRSELLSAVWHLPIEPGSGLLDVHMSRLRDKLGAQAWMVETVRGIGYRLRTQR
jgi:two-component system, OmpR family, response regulator